MAIMLSTIPRTRWTLAAPEAPKSASSSGDGEQQEQTTASQLSRTGRLLLTEHFVRQLRKKLYDQKDVLALVDHSQTWVLEIMYREFHAVRAVEKQRKSEPSRSMRSRMPLRMCRVSSSSSRCRFS